MTGRMNFSASLRIKCPEQPECRTVGWEDSLASRVVAPRVLRCERAKSVPKLQRLSFHETELYHNVMYFAKGNVCVGSSAAKRLFPYTGGNRSPCHLLRSTPSATGTAPTRMKIISPAMRTHSSSWQAPPIRNGRRRAPLPIGNGVPEFHSAALDLRPRRC